jgi:hypothetical protein
MDSEGNETSISELKTMMIKMTQMEEVMHKQVNDIKENMDKQ